LEASTTPYASKNFQVFLQGSYGNDTNIYAESDVDVVIRLDDCFRSDLSNLTEEEKATYKSAFRDATYAHADFKRDVLSVLTSQYGAAVKSGEKAIVVNPSGSRRKADVIVAIQYRRYFTFLRIPAKPGHRSDASEAIIPKQAGPVVKRSVDCRLWR
jgi:hypothetical protein